VDGAVDRGEERRSFPGLDADQSHGPAVRSARHHQAATRYPEGGAVGSDDADTAEPTSTSRLAIVTRSFAREARSKDAGRTKTG